MAASTVVHAPELDVSEWIGTPSPLAGLRGHVVLIEAFQILCPGCIAYGLPQARKVQRLFPEVTVLGLNTVFEHHEVTGPDALRVFLAEYGYTFPVGVDRHEAGPLPVTMQRYGLQGTPSTVLIDKTGTARFSHLGAIDDLALGMMLGRLVAEEPTEA